MAKINSSMKQVFDGTSVALEVDLDKMFGELAPDSTSFRQRVGQAILDKIVKNTEDNKYLNKAKLTYSKEYAESLEFKAHNKKKNDVNMKLTGDMLGLMDVIDESQHKITIGWTDDSDAAKAFNHVTGDTVPKRNFLGLQQKDVDSIVQDFQDELQLPMGDSETTSSVDLFNRFVNSSSNTGTRTLGQILKALNPEGDEF